VLMSKMDLWEVDLNLLKLFDALIKECSVTRAGLRLGLSQPAASRGLAKLRQLFNDPILIRSSNGWELTPRAISLAESISRLLTDAQAIVAPLAFNPSTTSGKFTIATADHLAVLLMPALISRLEVLAPDIDLEISAASGDNVDLIAQGGAELAIGVFNELPTRFYQRALYDEDFVCVVRDNHPLIDDQISLQQFVSLSHVSVIITGRGKNPVDQALAKQGLSRRVAMRLPHFLAAPMLVAKSDLVLSLPRRLAQEVAMTLPIKIHELPLEVAHFTPSIIWHGKQHNDPAHQWLRKLIIDIASELRA